MFFRSTKDINKILTKKIGIDDSIETKKLISL